MSILEGWFTSEASTGAENALGPYELHYVAKH